MELDVYECAYLCGGPDRAARTALLSLDAAGSVRVTESPPYRVRRLHGRTAHFVESGLMTGLPSSGLPVRLVVRGVADSPEVDRCAAALLKKKLLRRSFRRLVRPTGPGTKLRERLAAQVGDDEILRFAVLGTSPEPMRSVLAELPPEAEFPVKLARRQATSSYDDRGDYNPPLGNAGHGVP